MRTKFYLIYFAAAIFLLSCKSASKLYDKGRYDEAVETAAKKLQKDPRDKKLQDIVINSYRYAVEDHEARIRNNEESNNDLKWEWIYSEYAGLQRLYESIRKSPDVFELVKPTDYSSFLQTYREKSGENRYDRGIALMNTGRRDNYKKAYYEFQTALNYLPGDLGVRDKMEESFAMAVTNVVVLPLEQSGFQYSSYKYDFRNFDNNLVRYLQNNSHDQFIRFYLPAEARTKNIRVDQVADIRFTQFNIGRSRDEVSTREVFKDVVIKETVYRPDSIIKEYGRVKAVIKTINRTMRSEGLMRVALKDGMNRSVWNDDFTGQHFWSTQIVSYTGDIRALSDADKALVERQEERAPEEDLIIRSIMTEIQTKLECALKDYYKNMRY